MIELAFDSRLNILRGEPRRPFEEEFLEVIKPDRNKPFDDAFNETLAAVHKRVKDDFDREFAEVLTEQRRS